MNFSAKILPLSAALAGTVSHLQAGTISVNFTDNASVDSTMLASDVAGLPGVTTQVANWNNAHVNGTTGSVGGLVDDTGAPTGASAAWTSDLGQWRLPISVATGEDRMWKGYLDTASSTSVTVSGIPFIGTYSVIVYFDGDNGTSWRVGNYAIGAVTDGGEDSEGANWGTAGEENQNKVYNLPVAGGAGNQIWPVSPNNDEGNYVILSGITGSSFTLTAAGGASADIARAPINGFQIIGTIPEPSSALLGLAGLAGLLRRKRP